MACLRIFLDLAEAKALMAQLGFKLDAAKVEEYFKKYDADGSGSLDKDECKKLVADLMPDFF